MSYATASALIDAVRVELDSTAASDTVMYRLLNDYFLRIQRLHDFTFQEQVASLSMATSATDYTRYAQPTDAKELLDFYYIEGATRQYVTPCGWRDFLQLYPSPTAAESGQKPQHWTVFRDEIYVMPMSSAITGQMHYLLYLPEFTATASNQFLVWGEDALRYGLCASYATWLTMPERATGYGQLANDAVQSLLVTHQATKTRPLQSVSMRTPGTVSRYSRSTRKSLFDNRW